MRIIHCCLSNYYVDEFAYQENELVAAHVADGHDVMVIASTETFGTEKKITYLDPSDYSGADGARVVRLPYKKFLPQWIMRKLRMHPNVNGLLDAFKPDVIMFHGTCGWELQTVCTYVARNSHVILYVDSHEDYNNSARTFASKWLLHFCYYRLILLACLPRIRKILCVNVDSMHFLEDLYGVKSEKLEFFPLGGQIPTDIEYNDRRASIRLRFNLEDDNIAIIQSGKINRSKKLVESLTAFREIPDKKMRFFITGKIENDVSNEANALIAADPRVVFLGWLNPKELQDMLCGSDVYVQPGSQSSTMQMSLCSRCAVVLDDNISHKPYIRANGWLLNSELSMRSVFAEVSQSPDTVRRMCENSKLLAAELLDYKKLSNRILR